MNLKVYWLAPHLNEFNLKVMEWKESLLNMNNII